MSGADFSGIKIFRIMCMVWDYSFSSLTKFYEKLSFLTPWYAHVRMITIAKGGRRPPDFENIVWNCLVRNSYTKHLRLKIVNYFKSNSKFKILNNRNWEKHILNSFVILATTFMKWKKIPLKTFGVSALRLRFTKIFWIDSAWNKTTTFHINGFLFSGNQSDYTRY